MPANQVIDPSLLPERRGSRAPFTTSAGEVTTRVCVPEGFQQFVADVTLEKGAQLSWAGEQGDEALIVLDGSVTADGALIRRKGAVVVESGVAATVVAAEAARVLHVGSTRAGPVTSSVIGPPLDEGRGVHCQHLDADRTRTYTFEPVEVDGQLLDDVVHSEFYTDGTCPTCRIAVFRVWGAGPHRGASHSHSADELITVTEGEIVIGGERLTSGMTIAIPADRLYGFRTSAPWEFINYRADASFMTRARGGEPTFDGLTPPAR